MIVAMLFTLVPASAFAATDNYSGSIPLIKADEDQPAGSVIIREDADTDGWFENGDVITFTLPSGVEFKTEPTDSNFSVTDAAYSNGTVDFEVKVIAAGDDFVSIEIQCDVPAQERDTDDEAKITFNPPNIDVDSGITGDIKIEIESYGTAITPGYVTIARVVGGDTATTVSSVESIGIDSTGKIGTIRIKENAANVLDDGEITLTLPNDFEWKLPVDKNGNVILQDENGTINTETKINEFVSATAGLKVTKVSGFNTDELTIVVDKSGTSNQAGFIALTNLRIYVPDDADEGEVEMTVDGDDVTKEDVVVAKVGDYGFTVETKGDIPTIVAGKTDQDIADIIIDEVVDNSWIKDRTVKLELPSWAEWNKTNIKSSSNPFKDSGTKDEEEWKLTVKDGANGKAELKDLTVDIDADAPEGDLVVKISGSAGVEAEVVVAKVVPAFKVAAEKVNFVIGVQNQEVGDITITESEDGAIEKNKWIIFKAPSGMEFSECPTVEVVEGDIEIDDEDIDGRYFAFRIDGESAKKASVIKISDIAMTLDRTVPTGDVTFEVFMTSNDAEDAAAGKDDNGKIRYDLSKLKFKHAIDKDNYDEVTKIVVATVVTAAPGAATAEFTIGSTIYYVDGKAQILEAAPYIKNGRTYIPVRAAAEATGAVVNYDEATKTVTATKDGKEIVLVIGQVGASGVAPEIVNGRTFVPIRDLEDLGLKLGFDNLTKKVVVSSL